MVIMTDEDQLRMMSNEYGKLHLEAMNKELIKYGADDFRGKRAIERIAEITDESGDLAYEEYYKVSRDKLIAKMSAPDYIMETAQELMEKSVPFGIQRVFDSLSDDSNSNVKGDKMVEEAYVSYANNPPKILPMDETFSDDNNSNPTGGNDV